MVNDAHPRHATSAGGWHPKWTVPWLPEHQRRVSWWRYRCERERRCQQYSWRSSLASRSFTSHCSRIVTTAQLAFSISSRAPAGGIAAGATGSLAGLWRRRGADGGGWWAGYRWDITTPATSKRYEAPLSGLRRDSRDLARWN